MPEGARRAPLNVAEGSYNRRGNRPARYHTALGSLREVLACFEVAAALGCLPEVDAGLRARFDHVLGTLVRLVGGHFSGLARESATAPAPARARAGAHLAFFGDSPNSGEPDTFGQAKSRFPVASAPVATMPPHRSSTPSLSLIGYAFERAGLHPGVRVTIESAAWLGDALAVELRVFYAAGLQICCAELGCYMSAFSTRGLTAVARHIQAEELLDATPRLRVVATLELADGFAFAQPGLGAANGARLVYDCPEVVGPDA